MVMCFYEQEFQCPSYVSVNFWKRLQSTWAIEGMCDFIPFILREEQSQKIDGKHVIACELIRIRSINYTTSSIDLSWLLASMQELLSNGFLYVHWKLCTQVLSMWLAFPIHSIGSESKSTFQCYKSLSVCGYLCSLIVLKHDWVGKNRQSNGLLQCH